MPATFKTFEDYNYNSRGTATSNEQNSRVFCAVGEDCEMGRIPSESENKNENENYFDIFGCDTLSYVDDSHVDIYTENTGFNADTAFSSDVDSRPYVLESLPHYSIPTTSLYPYPYSHHPSPFLSIPPSHTHPPTPAIFRPSLNRTPLETLALDSIPMDLDLRTHRASDFLEVAARLYTRYCTVHNYNAL